VGTQARKEGKNSQEKEAYLLKSWFKTKKERHRRAKLQQGIPPERGVKTTQTPPSKRGEKPH